MRGVCGGTHAPGIQGAGLGSMAVVTVIYPVMANLLAHIRPSRPALFSGVDFLGQRQERLQVLNSQSCAELCPQRWSGRGQLTTWPAMQKAQWLLVEVWPWSGMTSTPAIGSSGAPLFLHTHWAAPCVHPLRPRLEPGHSQQQPLRCHAWPRKVTRPGQTQAHR